MRCERKTNSCKQCASFEKGIFSDLSGEDFHRLDQCKTNNRYRKKQILFYEGNPVMGLYCIRSGKIKLYKTNSEGKQHILKIARVGDILGHASFFSAMPHDDTAEVLEEADVCFFDKNHFFGILRENPSVSLKLLGHLSRELHQSQTRTMDLAYKPARTRLIDLLLVLKQNFGVYDAGICRLGIMLSREDLAQTIGATLETTVRLFGELRTEGIISFDKKTICIQNHEKLLAYCRSEF